MTWTISPALVRAVQDSRTTLVGFADGQARAILDQVAVAAKERNVSLARQSLARAEAMTWTISPAVMKSIDEARGALKAAEDPAAR